MRRLLWVAVALVVGAAGYLLGRFPASPERARAERPPVVAAEPESEPPAPEPEPAADSVPAPSPFEAQFVSRGAGPVIDGTTWKPGDALADGTVLRFPVGVHAWQVAALERAPRFPRDLSAEGAGMDETLLRLDEIRARGEIRNLAFRDVTIDCGHQSFTDLSTDARASIRLERCRVIRFDNGAGGSVMLRGSRVSFWATDSRIEGGFGREPGSGNLFRVRSGLVVRMERCTVRGPLRSIYDADRNASYVFASCIFEQLDATLRERVEQPEPGVAFDGCRFAFVEPRTDRKRAVRSPSELNPAWAPE